MNKTTAQVIAKSDLTIARTNDAFAFAFWGGDFWIFTSPGGASDVRAPNDAPQQPQQGPHIPLGCSLQFDPGMIPSAPTPDPTRAAPETKATRTE